MSTACQQRFADNPRSSANRFQATMTDAVFQRLSVFIEAQCGIELPPSKKTMLEGRIRKRLHSLGISSFENYCRYLFSPEGAESELSHMLDVVTTNKTDFFREPGHFDYLIKSALPDLIHLFGVSAKCFRMWSAACSTGEEPFTMAMVLSEFAQTHPGFQYDILATDISNQVLERAMGGIYEHDRIEPITLELRKKYLLKSKNPSKKIRGRSERAYHFQKTEPDGEQLSNQ
jgi:chemotaxis protein methyltransferase CheR